VTSWEPTQVGQGAAGDGAQVTLVRFLVNMEQDGQGYGGRVTITNERVRFTPNGPARARRLAGGAFRHRLRLRTHAGAVVYFVVWRPRREAAVINRILTGQGTGAAEQGGRHTR
jgi:hypothetical protein